jgi:hypothetical protein
VQYCPGEVCDVKAKQDIQKTTLSQFLVLLAFIGVILLTTLLMNEKFSEKPNDLMNNDKTVQTK